MSEATQCVYCSRPIDAAHEPSVRLARDPQGEALGEVLYVHLHCYAKLEKIGDPGEEG